MTVTAQRMPHESPVSHHREGRERASTATILALSTVAALAAAMAIVPPGGEAARGLRVERLRGAFDGRPLLLRISIEDAATRHWRAPAMARVRAVDPAGRVRLGEGTRVGRGPWTLVNVERGAFPVTLEVKAEGLEARSVIHADAPSAPFSLSDRGQRTLDIAVEGWVLSPEVGGAVLFKAGAERAGSTIDVIPDDPTLAIGPDRGTLDACGMAALYARPAGLAAPVLIRIGGEEHRFRLPLAPGAITTRLDGDTLTLAHALGGVNAYVLFGDPWGPLRWEQALLPVASEQVATATIRTPAEARWVVASASTDFERRSGAWKDTPPGLSPCTATALGAYFARIASATPPIPPVALVHDGASLALSDREARRARNRRRALWVNALALAALAALMLRSARTPEAALEREGLSSGSGARNVAALGVAALAVLAFAIALAVQLRA